MGFVSGFYSRGRSSAVASMAELLGNGADNTMRLIPLASLLLLAACTHPEVGPPAVEIRTVMVEKPVAIACVKRADIPTEPRKVAGDLTGDPRRDLDVVSASALALRQAFREAAALLQGCAK